MAGTYCSLKLLFNSYLFMRFDTLLFIKVVFKYIYLSRFMVYCSLVVL